MYWWQGATHENKNERPTNLTGEREEKKNNSIMHRLHGTTQAN